MVLLNGTTVAVIAESGNTRSPAVLIEQGLQYTNQTLDEHNPRKKEVMLHATFSTITASICCLVDTCGLAGESKLHWILDVEF